MKVLVFGSSGMLGRTLVSVAKELGHSVITSARTNSDYNLDITDDLKVVDCLVSVNPDVVINSAGLVSVEKCENNFSAWLVNARFVSILATYTSNNNIKFVQISTDHYYLDGKKCGHTESDKVSLVNDYARTKYAGEKYALLDDSALVVRTNITGFKGGQERTFIEWAINLIENNYESKLFDDYYTSTIDTKSFSRNLYRLIESNVCGVFNMASSQIFTKLQFVLKLAEKMRVEYTNYQIGSVSSLGVMRPYSLGLDVTKVENQLGLMMPNLEMVIENLLEARNELQFKH